MTYYPPSLGGNAVRLPIYGANPICVGWRFLSTSRLLPYLLQNKCSDDVGDVATIQAVSSTASLGLDCRFGEMRDLREIPPAAEGINDRFHAAHPLIRTKTSGLPVNDNRHRVNRVAHS